MTSAIWVTIGFAGQALFGLRFIVQWIASERKGYSIVPPLFWYLSVPAGILLVAYVCWRRDPVFIVSETACLGIFIRNAILLHSKPER
jgi:lipid-A-disaccharide synthase-like uncharacterized protein